MDKIQIRRLTDKEKNAFNIPDKPRQQGPWSVWECEPSSFDWRYDEIEIAYVYEGLVKVKTAQQELEIKSGDYVTFPAGLSCHWEVKERIRKVYKFV